MWGIIQDWITNWNGNSILARLVLAWIIGFVIGIDREHKRRTVGVRTHVLVSVGTALATMSAVYAHHGFPEASIDITRLGGQMIAGIGFLGAGAILVSKRNRIMGMSTAAGLWVCACSGMAIGFGFFEGTIITVLLVIFTQMILPGLEKRLGTNSRLIALYLEFEQGQNLKNVLRLLNADEVRYSDYQVIRKDDGKEGPIITIDVWVQRRKDKETFFAKVQELEGLLYISPNRLQ